MWNMCANTNMDFVTEIAFNVWFICCEQINDNNLEMEMMLRLYRLGKPRLFKKIIKGRDAQKLSDLLEEYLVNQKIFYARKRQEL